MQSSVEQFAQSKGKLIHFPIKIIQPMIPDLKSSGSFECVWFIDKPNVDINGKITGLFHTNAAKHESGAFNPGAHFGGHTYRLV